MPNLTDLIAGMAHGNIASIVQDHSVLDLFAALNQQMALPPLKKAQVIVDIYGEQNLLKEKALRNSILLSLTGDQRNQLANLLDVNVGNLENIRLTTHVEKKLFGYFGVELITANNHPPEPEYSQKVLPKYPLFEHQNAALQQCRDIFDSGSKTVMLHMPTGSGKTRTAMHLICRHLNNQPKGLVLWLVQGRELCFQAIDEFRTAWTSLGSRPVSLSRLFGQYSDDHCNDGLIVAGLSKIWNQLSRNMGPAAVAEFSRNLSLIIFDEAHQSVAETYQSVIEILMSNNEKLMLLGLSATPGRSQVNGDINEDVGLLELYSNKKVSLKIAGYDSPIHFLQQHGYLAKIAYERITYQSEEEDTRISKFIDRESSSMFSIPVEVLKMLGLHAKRNLAIIQKAVELVTSGGHKKVLLFAPDVRSADLLASVFRNQGVSSFSITANTPSSDREDNIRRFCDRSIHEPMILCNYGVLTTGFNAPATSAVIIARPTTSVVLYSQMVGRGTRGPKVGGNKEALVCTVMDTSIPIYCSIVEQFTHWDEQWESNR